MKQKFFKIAVASIFLVLAIFLQKADFDIFKIEFFSVGQGDAIYARYGTFDFLVDGGPDNQVLAEYDSKTDYFDDKLDFLLLTHSHDDHVAGAFTLLERRKIGQIFFPEELEKSGNFQRLKKLAKEKNVPIAVIKQTSEMIIGDLKIAIWPINNENSKNLNDSSLVMKVSFQEKDFLLTGDISEKGEEALLKKNLPIQAEVLKVSHHGSHFSTTPEFLKIVSPTEAVISVGKNSFGHPSSLILQRLTDFGTTIYRTDQLKNPAFAVKNANLIFSHD